MSIEGWFQPKRPKQNEVEEPYEQPNEILAELDQLMPSGDPVLDATRYDQMTNQGLMHFENNSQSTVLIHLVSMRESYRNRLASAPEGRINYRELMSKSIETVTRILDFYGVKEQTWAEIMSPEKHAPVEESTEQERLDYLSTIRAEIDSLTDRIGTPVDEGVKNLVVLLNAYGCRTSGSCEGHADRDYSLPYIDVGPETPRNYQVVGRNQDLKRRLESSADKMKSKVGELLGLFYEGRSVSDEAKLSIDAYPTGLRIQPAGTDRIESLGITEEKEHLFKLCQEEVQEFGKFLEKQFLTSGQVREFKSLFEHEEFPEDVEYEQSAEYGSEFKPMIEALNNFPISGDLQKDVISFAEVLKWHESTMQEIRSGQVDLIHFLIYEYQRETNTLAHTDPGVLNAYWRVVVPHRLKTLDRILNHYNVSARTESEYIKKPE
jgi:hypothetical protein